MARVFGAIAGIAEGTSFVSRREAHDAGVHRPLQAGISGAAAEGADSIVVSGGYEDDEDYGDTIVYTGHGGNDPATGQQIADQTLDRGNAALARNHDEGLLLRVIRGADGDPTFSPTSGYRYDGVYLVDDYWQEAGKSGHLVWRYRLVKQPPGSNDQPRNGASATPATGARPLAGPAGADYVPAVATTATQGEPFEVDPDKLDRATRGHADLQNRLAARLNDLGIDVLSPAVPHDPEFDIAWRHRGVLFVCEVKTMTAENRDRQLRLALGQVLHYAAALNARGERVEPLILTPTIESSAAVLWRATLHGAGVRWLLADTLDDDSALLATVT